MPSPIASSCWITASKLPRVPPPRSRRIRGSSKRTWDGREKVAEPVLKFEAVHTYYGAMHVLKGVDYELFEGEIVCLLGGNASGKSTTMKTVLGIVKPTRGQVIYRGERIDTLDTSQIIARGIGVVPEARRVFPRMTVLENLEMGAFSRRGDKAGMKDDFERVYGLFPRLRERRTQLAGTMSGGEQQMLAMGRALMSRPKLLCMD